MTATIIIFIVAAISVFLGFRRGIARCIPSALGVAFGSVSARLLGPALIPVMNGAFPAAHDTVFEHFTYSVMSRSLVFVCVYAIFAAITGFLTRVLEREDRSILDNMSGAVFVLFRNLLFLSLILNCWLAVDNQSELLRSARSDDANAVEVVMLLGPVVVGGPDVADLWHEKQLLDARKISLNLQKNREIKIKHAPGVFFLYSIKPETEKNSKITYA